jgi:hypothetical protein
MSIYYDYAFPAGNGGSVYIETVEYDNSVAYFLFSYAGENLCLLLTGYGRTKKKQKNRTEDKSV